ncbi:MAG: hypothetical protein M1836_007468 [Candelina mexicana]|nr:MAG: hypothetical protein M1836_007468 [Candelina mexicana]
MLDPLSLAGLTIAIFDQLLKLGERTAELVSDVRTFDETYGGQTLYEQFDEELQDQIKLWLVQLVGVLHEAHHLLEGRYVHTITPTPSVSPTSDSLSPVSASTTDLSRSRSLSGLSATTLPLRSASPQVPLRKATKSPLLLLRWSFKDKGRVEAIVRKFGELNARIHKNIEIECMCLVAGVNNRQHLEHLAADDDSKMLGFSSDAALKLSTGQAESTPGKLELVDDSWNGVLQNSKPFEERFAVCQYRGRNLLQEYRLYPTEHAQTIDERTRERAEALAKLLLQPKKTMYRIPRCVGWKYLASQNRLAFVFDVPEGHEAKPRSLLRLLNDSNVKPSLGEKFRLAHGLARCIAQLQMVKWVHESFRSENILFFPPKAKEGGNASSSKTSIEYSEPWVMGFEFSRPEGDFSTGFVDIHPARDVYRHPERQGRPQRMFNKMHDIYALGVVLLEIGLWSPALSLQKDQFTHARDPMAVQARLVKNAEVRLGAYVGDRFKEIVLKCLIGHFGIKEDTKEDLRLQQAFRSQVVDVLEQAANSI